MNAKTALAVVEHEIRPRAGWVRDSLDGAQWFDGETGMRACVCVCGGQPH